MSEMSNSVENITLEHINARTVDRRRKSSSNGVRHSVRTAEQWWTSALIVSNTVQRTSSSKVGAPELSNSLENHHPRAQGRQNCRAVWKIIILEHRTFRTVEQDGKSSSSSTEMSALSNSVNRKSSNSARGREHNAIARDTHSHATQRGQGT